MTVVLNEELAKPAHRGVNKIEHIAFSIWPQYSGLLGHMTAIVYVSLATIYTMILINKINKSLRLIIDSSSSGGGSNIN
jgi:hypothetical protein